MIIKQSLILYKGFLSTRRKAGKSGIVWLFALVGWTNYKQWTKLSYNIKDIKDYTPLWL